MSDYLDKLHEEAIKQPGFAEVWEPYRIMCELIDERCRLGLSQREIAEKIGTSQAVIARMEGDPPQGFV